MSGRQAPPDHRERERALNWEQSFIVRARRLRKNVVARRRYLHLLARAARRNFSDHFYASGRHD